MLFLFLPDNIIENIKQTFQLAVSVLKRLLHDFKAAEPEMAGWDHTRTSYMKRYGGQNARGWELVLTFKEDIPLTNV